MTTEYSGSGDVSRSLDLLWGRQERPSRGPKPGLTIEQIVAVAVAVADAEGIEAVSMRRVASELDVGTMSLYRYIPGKGELLDLMLDKVIEPRNDLGSPEELGWRRMLEVFARDAWRLYESHPWLLQVDQARPILGPNALAGVDFVVRGLAGRGLGDQEMIMVMSIVYGYVTGVARDYVSSLQAERRTGVSDGEFWKAQEPVLDEVMRSGRFPALARLSEDAFSFSYEQLFEFGLDQLLNGLAAYIERAGETPAS